MKCAFDTQLNIFCVIALLGDGEDLPGGFVIIIFLGIYLAARPRTYVDGFVSLFPQARRDQVRQVLSEIATTLRYWLLGQIVVMTIVGLAIGVGLQLLGVPLPLALAIVAGLLEFIPYFGPLVSAIPAVLLAFLHSPLLALGVALLFIGVNFLEGNLLLPTINQYSVSMPPAVTLISLVLMGSLFGFLGLLLATPTAATVMVLVKRLHVDRLNNRASNSQE